MKINLIIIKSEEYELAILLIKNNLDKKPIPYINFKKNNIFLWPKNKIKRLLINKLENEFIFLEKLNQDEINIIYVQNK